MNSTEKVRKLQEERSRLEVAYYDAAISACIERLKITNRQIATALGEPNLFRSLDRYEQVMASDLAELRVLISRKERA